MEILPRQKYEKTQRTRLVVTFVLEIGVLVFLAVLGYYIRTSDTFPVRCTPFSYNDPTISHTLSGGHESMAWFAYLSDVPEVAIVVISFCLPPVIMFACEIARCRLTCNDRTTIRSLCFVCNISTSMRRVLRFTGAFIMGILIVMIFTDVTKFMIGRPRPIFLEICSVNRTKCNSQLNTSSIDLIPSDICNPSTACSPVDASRLLWARKSFPSFHASITAFASGFLAIYWQEVVGHGLHCSILGPFMSLAFIIMSLLCCLARYALFYSHWTDVAVGFGLGIILAVYIAVYALRNFNENRKFNGANFPEFLPSYKQDDWFAEKDKVPWYWAPWQWNAQDYVQPKEPDRQEVHHRNEGHVSSPESVLRHKSRDGHTLETIYY